MTAALPQAAGADLFGRVKEAVDLHDLAERLGLKRHGSNGNYHSPHRADKKPSLSIIPGGRGWKDHTTGQGGSCIDLLMHVRPEIGGPMEAARQLAQWYGIPTPSIRSQSAQPEEKPLCQFIAEKSFADAEKALGYLLGRGIDEAAARHAIQKRAIGWNAYRNPKIAAGEPNHGGPAVVFVVRSLEDRAIVAVDMRYVDPDLNGGVKHGCQGAKDGYAWTSDASRLRTAHTVYVVESPINALSVESCPLPAGTAVIALRGTANATALDLAFLAGKRVIVALDQADRINPETGERPGLANAWRLIDRLVAAGISAGMVDMQDWEEGEDINDVLRKHGVDELGQRLRRLDEWLIPGMPGGGDRESLAGRRRLFLPEQDYKVYWRYRLKEDFTHYVDEWKDDDDGKRSESLGDLCAFRVAGFSTLLVQGHLATITGKPDAQPETVFGVDVQVPRYGRQLQRRICNDRALFNIEWWKGNFGAVYKPNQFGRMLNILERSASLGRRDVVNFVGLAWRNGKLSAIEGRDCHFSEPEKQCWYHNMTFPRGSAESARAVVAAYQATFKANAAAIALVWALGAHLKCILGFWPHLAMQADKGAGKSKLLESLQSTLAFQVLSGQMLKTDFRRRVSVSYTSHPIGWDEFSKLPKAVLGDIDAMLQSTYRFEFTRTNTSLTSHLLCAPVILSGEEVDVRSLQSKICRTSLTVAKQGPLVSHDLPQFPVWQWLQFLERSDPSEIRESYRRRLEDCEEQCRAPAEDATARRMMENYAAILTAWDCLCRFSGIGVGHDGFVSDLMTEMNAHISETDGARKPFAWILEILVNEIDANRFEHPFMWDVIANSKGASEEVLCISAEHIIHHIETANHLRQKFDALPVKTGTIFKKQLQASGLIVADGIERTIRGKRQRYLMAISVAGLHRLGIHANPNMN